MKGNGIASSLPEGPHLEQLSDRHNMQQYATSWYKVHFLCTAPFLVLSRRMIHFVERISRKIHGCEEYRLSCNQSRLDNRMQTERRTNVTKNHSLCSSSSSRSSGGSGSGRGWAVGGAGTARKRINMFRRAVNKNPGPDRTAEVEQRTKSDKFLPPGNPQHPAPTEPTNHPSQPSQPACALFS